MNSRTLSEHTAPNIFIFDLDMTLYGRDDFVDTDDDKIYYESFKQKELLNRLLSSLKHPKFIITNANHRHANDVLRRLGIKRHFGDIIAIDDVTNEKPHPEPFILAHRQFQIQPTDKVVFFEDNVHNLLTAKSNNWMTVLIDPDNEYDGGGKRYGHVDLTFKSIEEALIYFISQNRVQPKPPTIINGGAKKHRVRRKTAKRRLPQSHN